MAEHGPGWLAQAPALTRTGQVLAVLLLAGMALAAFLAFAPRALIYLPSRSDPIPLAGAASAAGFEPWRNASGGTIGYRSLPAPEDRRPPLAILLCHGNAGYALHRAVYAPVLRRAAPDRAVSVYLLEYPGYGARSGRPSQTAFLRAAAEALDQIPAGLPVLLLGESIGTGVVSGPAAAHPDRVAGLLLLTPFDSLASVARHHYPLLPVGWLLRDPYPSDQWLPKYRGPVAFILAAGDTIVPAQLGRRLHDAYAGPKKLLLADSADHNDLLDALSPAAWREALEFLLRRPSGQPADLRLPRPWR
ncbi:MAG: alpha/beta hydrolase [Verrucomicrobiota bacterium]